MICALILSLTSIQEVVPKVSSAQDLDFWIGQWECDSHRPQPDGTVQYAEKLAKNSIQRTLGNKVIEESFFMRGFTGKSWSVYNEQTKKWHQTWVDDTAGYLLLEGGKVGSEFILNQTHPVATLRMRFTDIKKDSFTWIWEQRDAEGAHQLRWKLDYKRVKA